VKRSFVLFLIRNSPGEGPLSTAQTLVLDVASGVAVLMIGSGFGYIVRMRREQRRDHAEARQMREDWRGEPARPGVPERPGVMVRLSRIESGQTYQGHVQAVQGQYLEQVWHELHPNSGLSLRDSVSRIHLATTGQPDPGAAGPSSTPTN
jgi:hypothetical protein